MSDGLPESVNVLLNDPEIREAVAFIVKNLGHRPTSAARYLMARGVEKAKDDGLIPRGEAIRS